MRDDLVPLLTALLGKRWGNRVPERGGGLPMCLGIPAKDDAAGLFLTQWAGGGVKGAGSWVKKQPSKPPWLVALAFSGTSPVGTVTAAGQPPPQPQAGTLTFFHGHTARRFSAE